MLTQSELLRKIEKCIAKNELKKALECLEGCFKDTSLNSDIILFSQRLKVLKQQERSGASKQTDITMEYSKLSRNILDFAQEYFEQDTTPSKVVEYTDQPYRRAVVQTVILKLLYESTDSRSESELFEIAHFKQSVQKKQLRRLFFQSLEKMQCEGIIINTKELDAKGKETKSYRLTAKGMQLLVSFENTMLFKKRKDK